MIKLKEVITKYVQDLEKMETYEKNLDDILRTAINLAGSTFETEFEIYTPYATVPKGAIKKLMPKYAEEGWIFDLYGYPNITVRVDMRRYKPTLLKELQLVTEDKTDPVRAVKV